MFKTILFSTVIALSAVSLAACDDDTGSKASSENPFNPGGGSDAGTQPGETTDSGTKQPDSGCPNKPAGCFCGTPTTQAQWLNRCTTSAALPVNLNAKPATTADIP
jgi:hypothetical protein